MNKSVGIIIGVVILVFGGFWFLGKDNSSVTNEPEVKVEAPEEENAMMEGSDAMMDTVYTLADVAEHADPGDCWLAIHGNVYDVTAFIESGKHGGGNAILEGCGIDATELYETRPMGSGTPHSQAARDLLATFQIGTLAE